MAANKTAIQPTMFKTLGIKTIFLKKKKEVEAL